MYSKIPKFGRRAAKEIKMLHTLAFPQTEEVAFSISPMEKLIIRKALVLFTYLSHMKLVFPFLIWKLRISVSQILNLYLFV